MQISARLDTYTASKLEQTKEALGLNTTQTLDLAIRILATLTESPIPEGAEHKPDHPAHYLRSSHAEIMIDTTRKR